MPVAPSTNQSPPLISKTRPTRNKKIGTPIQKTSSVCSWLQNSLFYYTIFIEKSNTAQRENAAFCEILLFFSKTSKNLLHLQKSCVIIATLYRGIVQSVEHQSPKLGVVGSSPSAPAKKKADCVSNLLFSVKSADGGRNPPSVDEIALR